VSGGEPCEVQDNVRGEPTTTVTIDDDGGSIIGATVQRNERWVNGVHIKWLTSSTKVYTHSHGLFYHWTVHHDTWVNTFFISSECFT